MENLCETCWHYDYDEEYDEYYCMMDLDEDEVYRYVHARRADVLFTGRETIIHLHAASKHFACRRLFIYQENIIYCNMIQLNAIFTNFNYFFIKKSEKRD